MSNDRGIESGACFIPFLMTIDAPVIDWDELSLGRSGGRRRGTARVQFGSQSNERRTHAQRVRGRAGGREGLMELSNTCILIELC